ncbi:sodium-dependent transporter [Actinotalea sp. BY-33]|uniref:Sodium-dependent transporter n=1 Tax=Actinotalea soli TaxID=2819234 RepID=A0A939RSI0_9CELL|nr:sodium-dependent transporter [Actinotalea soli]MBO1751372.1 sodium-dependent transporter [Actinotalea soli]
MSATPSDSPTPAGVHPGKGGSVEGHAPREQWSGQLGFVLAAIGSAVGLGNIWRFPGVAYENGGGAFLIPYLVALLTAGIPILLLDYSIGHRFRGSAPTAFRRLHRRAEPLGWFQVGVSCVIILYYTVIIAWSASYLVFSFTRAWGDDPGAFLETEYLQATKPGISLDVVPQVLVPLVLVWVVTIAILALGVQKGVERANKVFIPLLLVMFLGLVIRAVTLDGAMDGLNAFFTPDWSALSDPGVWIAAYSQIFFSLSIAFGIMITYSSYLKRRANLTSTGFVVGFANSSFELLAGIGVFAALGFMAFQTGVDVSEVENIAGVTLAFVAFPQIISMMPGGPVFGVLFFGSLTLAGLTSLLSILQVVSAAVQEKLGITPRQAALRIGGVAAVLSIALFSTTTALFLLDTMDKYINEVGVVGSAVVMTLVLGLVLRRLGEQRAHLNDRPGLRLGAWWSVLVGVVAPAVLAFMLVQGIRSLLGEPYEGYPWWFLNAFGWGVVGLALLVAVVMTALRWRRSPDDFTPAELSPRALRRATSAGPPSPVTRDRTPEQGEQR